MLNVKNACYNCRKRAPHCHATCPDYAEFSKKNAERRDARSKERSAKQGFYEHVGKTIANVRRRTR